MKLVIDCNVVISAGITDGICRQVILKAFREYTVIVTDEILSEYKAVSDRKKFFKVQHFLFELINIFESSAIKTEDIPIKDLTLPDSDDLIYLYACVNAKAKYLVTGNMKHFPEQNYAGTKILSPKEFLSA